MEYVLEKELEDTGFSGFVKVKMYELGERFVHLHNLNNIKDDEHGLLSLDVLYDHAKKRCVEVKLKRNSDNVEFNSIVEAGYFSDAASLITKIGLFLLRGPEVKKN